jgi:D-alanyl-D-alanine carboxypeptidase
MAWARKGSRLPSLPQVPFFAPGCGDIVYEQSRRRLVLTWQALVQLVHNQRRLGLPLLIGLLACFSYGFGPPVLVDSASRPVRLYPGQIAEIQAAHQLPEVAAKAAILVDIDTGQILLEHNARARLPMASTTKIMTALLALEQGDLDAVVTVPAEALHVGESSMFLQAGEQLTLRDLLYGLLMVSGNDAAMTIALHMAGSEAAFVQMMNERAASLGLTDTRFANPHGLDAPNHFSSAADLYRLARAALAYPEFATMVSTTQHTVPGHTLVNKNELLGLYAGADGIKTGTTDLAGECLVASVQRNGHRAVAVILGSTQRYEDARRLFDHYDTHYSWLPLAPPANALGRARDTTGEPRFLVAGAPADTFAARWQRPLIQSVHDLGPVADSAPGAPAGTMHYRIGAHEVAAQPLVWARF